MEKLPASDYFQQLLLQSEAGFRVERPWNSPSDAGRHLHDADAQPAKSEITVHVVFTGHTGHCIENTRRGSLATISWKRKLQDFPSVDRV